MLGPNYILMGRRRIAPHFDADYQAVLTFATAQGWSLPSAPQQTLGNQLVLDLKAAGVWNKLDFLYIFANNANQDFAIINWKAPGTFNGTRVNSPTWASNQGFTGNGIDSHINSNFNPTVGTPNFAQDNASLFTWARTASGAANNMMGQTSGSSIIALNASATTHRINAGGALPAAGDLSGTGFMHMARPDSTTCRIIKDTTVTSFNVASAAPANSVITFLRRAGNYGDMQLSIAGAGSNLISENTAMFNAFNTYMSGL
jgi:hypothetical protein